MMVDFYSVGIQMYMTIINIIIFVILGLYLDQVFPNEFGRKKHPLFFLDFLFKSKEASNDSQIQIYQSE